MYIIEANTQIGFTSIIKIVLSYVHILAVGSVIVIIIICNYVPYKTV